MKRQQPIENIIPITYQPPNQQTWFYKPLYGEDTDAQRYATIQQLQHAHTLLTNDRYARINKTTRSGMRGLYDKVITYVQTPYTRVQRTDNPENTCAILTLGWSRHQLRAHHVTYIPILYGW